MPASQPSGFESRTARFREVQAVQPIPGLVYSGRSLDEKEDRAQKPLIVTVQPVSRALCCYQYQGLKDILVKDFRAQFVTNNKVSAWTRLG